MKPHKVVVECFAIEGHNRGRNIFFGQHRSNKALELLDEVVMSTGPVLLGSLLYFVPPTYKISLSLVN
jgi:hypothetical protein